MRVARWASGAALAVALAAAPGLAQLEAPSNGLPERAPVTLERRTDPSPPRRRPAPPLPVEEVQITAPEVFEGEVAKPTAPAPIFKPSPVPADGEVFALLVGIDDYPGRRDDLRSAVADVDTIDAALDGFGVPSGNRVVLRDGQATKAEVTAALESLVRQGGPGATYVFAYAGHARFLDPDTHAIVLADGDLLRDHEMAELLAPATTQRMWLVFASCFGGGFTELLAPGRILTGAAPANELAWEDPALNASYLVHYLVREGWLFGRAGDSVEEAFEYADRALAREHPNRRPVEVDFVRGRLVLGAGDPADALDQAPPGPQPPSDSTPSRPPPSSPPPAPPPEQKPACLLGVLC